jgi:pimeloyl-ACP methyl ester carboxylesterase
MKVTIGDTVLYYESHGDGYPLILIRGVGSNADHWYEQVPVLSRKYRVITFDNRGVARSSYTGEDFSVLMMAQDTIGLMDALGITKSHIMGLSMGGMIAQEMAINYPDRVKGLILACTHCGGPHQLTASAEVGALFMEMIYIASDESKVKAAACLFARETLEKKPEVARRYAEISLKHPADTKILSKQWEAVLKYDTFDRLPQIKAPTLVLTGNEDLLVPPGNSKILAERIPGAELKVIAGGGHQVLVEQPEACNKTIMGFLRGLDGVSPSPTKKRRTDL